MLPTPIVQLLFERGRFLPADTVATAAALQLLRDRPGRLLGGANRVAGLLRARRSRVPVIVSIVTIGVNLVFSLMLVRCDRVPRARAGTSIAALSCTDGLRSSCCAPAWTDRRRSTGDDAF